MWVEVEVDEHDWTRYREAMETIDPSVISSTLSSTLSAHFLQPGRAIQTVFSLTVTDGTHPLQAQVETSEAKVLSSALSSFRDLALSSPGSRGFTFDAREGTWVKYR